MFLFAAIAVFLALPSLLVAGALALRRKTRYFALPLVAGSLVGGAAALLPPWPPAMSFIVGFGLVAAPLTVLCAVVAAMGWAEARAPNSRWPRNAFAIAFGAVALAIVADWIDRPAIEPSARLAGTIRSSSTTMRDDGFLEERADIALDDGRAIRATSMPFAPKAVASPTFVFPARLESQARRVRVEEHRAIITGRATYTFIPRETPQEKQ